MFYPFSGKRIPFNRIAATKEQDMLPNVNLDVKWKPDYLTQCRETVGKMVYDFDNGDIAKITVMNPDAPELPNMEFIEHIGWSYHTTEFHQTTRDRVTYYFFVGDFNEEQLRMVVFIFDTLYG